jgi:hypothetical protein
MDEMRASLAPAAVEPILSGRFGHPYRYDAEVESTQALLEAEDPEGAVAVAEHQNALTDEHHRGDETGAPRAPVSSCDR